MTIELSGKDEIDAILYRKGDIYTNNEAWFTLTSNVGESATVTYSWNNSKIKYTDQYPVTAPLDGDQKFATTQALIAWSDVAAIRFINDEAAPAIVFAEADLSDNGSYTTLASTRFLLVPNSSDSDYKLSRADVVYDVAASGFSQGGAGFEAAIHEIGHVLGLTHPLGVLETDPTSNPKWLNTGLTVMSYDRIKNESGQIIHATTPMIYDVAAAQYLYGVNQEFRVGVTNYGLIFDGARKAWTVWDAGGIDTFDGSAFSSTTKGVYINLTGGVDDKGTPEFYDDEAIFSIIGEERVAIAFDPRPRGLGISGSGVVDIEVAIGGAGKDTIIGGFVGNTLKGGGGNDIISGRGGQDFIYGEAGNDRLSNSTELAADYVAGMASRDELYGGTGNDALMARAGISSLYGEADNDTLVSLVDDPESALDFMDGGSENDTLWGGRGDLLSGGAGDDWVWMNTSTATVGGGAVTDRDTYVAYSGNNWFLNPIATISNSTFYIRPGAYLSLDADFDETNRLFIGNVQIKGTFYERGGQWDFGNGYWANRYSVGEIRIFDARNQLVTTLDYQKGDFGLNLEAPKPDSVPGAAASLPSVGDVPFKPDFLSGFDYSLAVSGDSATNVLTSSDVRESFVGGAGADTFRFAAPSRSTPAAMDVVQDFTQGQDRLDLRGVGATGIRAGAASGTVLGYTSDASGTTITNATSSFALKLSGTVTLAASDFIFTNKSPVLAVPLIDQSASEGTAFSYTFAAGSFTDADAGDVLTYSAALSDGTALPAWLSFSPATRTFYGRPNSTAGGTYAITVTARDGAGGVRRDEFLLTVADTTTFDTYNGTSAADSMTGTAAAEAINGLWGNDTIQGLAGADTLDGGSGFDLASYAASPAAVSVNLATGGGTGGHAESDVLRNTESVLGSAYADTLIGSTADNRLEGGAGSDSLDGGAGDDTLLGGAGADSLTGGTGTRDVLSYAGSGAGVTVDLALGTASGGHATGDSIAGFEQLIGSALRDRLTGDALANALYGEDENDTLSGGGGNDTLDGGSGNDWLYGGDGNDRISDAVGLNKLFGEAGNDSLTGGQEADSLDGGLDNDLLDGGLGNDTLRGGAGADRLTDTFGDNALYGDDGTDTLTGGTGNDLLSGGNDNDSLIGGVGADTINGGVGDDTLNYGFSDAGVTVDLALNAASGGHATGDVISGIEHLIGSAYGDRLSGSSVANRLDAGSGDDTLLGAAGDDSLYGGNGNDSLTGGTGADLLSGGSGDDTFTYAAGAGADTIFDGGTGTDLLLVNGYTMAQASFARVGNTTDLEIVFSATDRILVQQGLENGGDSLETVRIGGVDKTIGAIRAEVLQKQTTLGADSITGFAGIASTLAGGAGNDTLTGDTQSDLLSGDAGNDLLDGDGGNDTLLGGDGLDSLLGGYGNDALFGDAGNDTLAGSYGIDTLTGGSGADIFRFGVNASELGVGAAADRIADFNRVDGDKISLVGFGFTAANFVGTAAFAAGGIREFGYAKLSDAGGTYTLVRIDYDNNGVSDREVRLEGVQLDLTAADFMFS